MTAHLEQSVLEGESSWKWCCQQQQHCVLGWRQLWKVEESAGHSYRPPYTSYTCFIIFHVPRAAVFWICAAVTETYKTVQSVVGKKNLASCSLIYFILPFLVKAGQSSVFPSVNPLTSNDVSTSWSIVLIDWETLRPQRCSLPYNCRVAGEKRAQTILPGRKGSTQQLLPRKGPALTQQSWTQCSTSMRAGQYWMWKIGRPTSLLHWKES